MKVMLDLADLAVFALSVIAFSIIALAEIHHSIRMQGRVDQLPKTGDL